MESAFLYCAIIGGTVFTLQLLLSLLGLEFDGDFDVDGIDAGDASGALFGVLSIRAIVAAILF